MVVVWVLKNDYPIRAVRGEILVEMLGRYVSVEKKQMAAYRGLQLSLNTAEVTFSLLVNQSRSEVSDKALF